MKTYYAYEDGTFWSVITKCNCCWTVSESGEADMPRRKADGRWAVIRQSAANIFFLS
jgi:hypothetical protein